MVHFRSQAVVLGHPLTPRRRAGLELTAAAAHGKVGDEIVRRLAGAV